MALILRSVEPTGDARARIRVEVVTSGVAAVDVKFVGSVVPSAAPLHWRVGDGHSPPLDIAMTAGGVPQALQVVLQDAEPVGLSAGDPAKVSRHGLPVFNVEQWEPNRYRTEAGALAIYRLSNGVMRAAFGPHVSRVVYAVSGCSFLVTGDGALSGIDIGPLGPTEWSLLPARDVS